MQQMGMNFNIFVCVDLFMHEHSYQLLRDFIESNSHHLGYLYSIKGFDENDRVIIDVPSQDNAYSASAIIDMHVINGFIYISISSLKKFLNIV